ncbi:MAG: DUF4399 domain-containing protein [Proteobacteria bacterium]|jgi:hypothetical protein|nr:DUF4399 domain-containing protein [Pseudomonadota bacterium]
MLKRLSSAIVFALMATAAHAEEPAAYIVTPADGATVKSPFTVVFGLRNPWGVAPAGTKLDNTGHHHLLIDTPLPDLTQPIAKDDQHRHFGGGQTETTVTLPPGKHTLQLLLGDFAHVPHQPPVMSKPITVTVE